MKPLCNVKIRAFLELVCGEGRWVREKNTHFNWHHKYAAFDIKCDEARQPRVRKVRKDGSKKGTKRERERWTRTANSKNQGGELWIGDAKANAGQTKAPKDQKKKLERAQLSRLCVCGIVCARDFAFGNFIVKFAWARLQVRSFENQTFLSNLSGPALPILLPKH